MGKELGSGRLGELYNGKKARKRREWRGFKRHLVRLHPVAEDMEGPDQVHGKAEKHQRLFSAIAGC